MIELCVHPSDRTRGLPSLTEPPRCGLCALPPADTTDPVTAAYKQGVDRTLLRENLKLTPAQRAEKFAAFMRFVAGLRRAGKVLP